MKNFFLNHKPIIVITSVVIIIVLFYSLTQNSKKQSISVSQSPVPSSGLATVPPASIPPSQSKSPVHPSLPVNVSTTIDTNSLQTKTSISNKVKLAGKLPIYIQNFKTSSGVFTTINVYTIPQDPDYLIHLEIYGIDYEVGKTATKDANSQAFIDSFNEIKSRLSAFGVNLKSIYFIFGSREYIQSEAEYWIKTYGLL